ncbi:MAG TPA: MIP family channel protein [Ktedonobacterales bacterium]|nr:MIP family channel protein [Ktedonobacterales bacterium]
MPSLATPSRRLALSVSSADARPLAPLRAAVAAETVGTFGLVFAGCGAIMVDQLSSERVTHVGVGLVFGLIITVMIYATGHISGAHLNPAVTLGFTVSGRFPARRLPAYWAAQLAGAIAAALFLRWALGDVAHLGATTPAIGGVTTSFVMEALLTFFLMLVIMAVATDDRAQGRAAALAIGATVGLEALFAGPVSGASMNPARSLGPALVAGIWTAQWLYLIAPAIGACVAALFYEWLRAASRLDDAREPAGIRATAPKTAEENL